MFLLPLSQREVCPTLDALDTRPVARGANHFDFSPPELPVEFDELVSLAQWLRSPGFCWYCRFLASLSLPARLDPDRAPTNQVGSLRYPHVSRRRSCSQLCTFIA